MPIVPRFMLCLDLSARATLTNHQDREKKPKNTDNVIECDANLGLKRDLANKTNALKKGVGVGGVASDNEKLLCHVASLACATDASKVAHLAVGHKGGTLVFLCGFGMDRKKKRKNAGTAAVEEGERRGGDGQSCSSAT